MNYAMFRILIRIQTDLPFVIKSKLFGSVLYSKFVHFELNLSSDKPKLPMLMLGCFYIIVKVLKVPARSIECSVWSGKLIEHYS